MADKCPECPDEGLPGWMGTFADMMTLLFAFFVLMFSMATMDPVKLAAFSEAEAEKPNAKCNFISCPKRIKLEIKTR